MKVLAACLSVVVFTVAGCASAERARESCAVSQRARAAGQYDNTTHDQAAERYFAYASQCHETCDNDQPSRDACVEGSLLGAEFDIDYARFVRYECQGFHTPLACQWVEAHAAALGQQANWEASPEKRRLDECNEAGRVMGLAITLQREYGNSSDDLTLSLARRELQVAAGQSCFSFNWSEANRRCISRAFDPAEHVSCVQQLTDAQQHALARVQEQYGASIRR